MIIKAHYKIPTSRQVTTSEKVGESSGTGNLAIGRVKHLGSDEIFALKEKYNANKDLINYLTNKSQLHEKIDGVVLVSLKKANEVIADVRQSLARGRANIPDSYTGIDSITGECPIRDVAVIRTIRDHIFKNYSNKSVSDFIVYTSVLSKMFKTGNCAEYSSNALISYGANLDYGESLYIKAIKGTEHQWSGVIRSVEKGRYDLSQGLVPFQQKIVMDAWAYGPPVLAEDYPFQGEAIPECQKFFFNDPKLCYLMYQMDKKIKANESIEAQLDEVTKDISMRFRRYSVNTKQEQQGNHKILDASLAEYNCFWQFKVQFYKKLNSTSNHFERRVARRKIGAEQYLLLALRYQFGMRTGDDKFVKNQLKVLNDIRKVCAIKECLSVPFWKAARLAIFDSAYHH